MSNIQTLEILVNIANMIGVIALALSLLGGGASVFLSRKLNAAQKVELRAKEEQREREKQISDENIASANAKAAKANEGLGKANERIAQANEQAQTAIAAAAEARIKQQELALESRAKQKELAEAQTRLIDEQKELADAQRKQAEAELALKKTLETVSRRTQRTLTAEQRQEIIRVLKEHTAMTARLKKPVPRISIVMIDIPEANAYALELNEAITAAGWDTVLVSVKSLTPPVYGIVCRCNFSIPSRPNTSAPDVLPDILHLSGFALRRALSSADILFTEERGAEQLTLVVGYKKP